MAVDEFNLEDEYGDLLDLLEVYISEVDPSLEHFGVKGMKWGVRKDSSSKIREPLKSLGPDSVTRKTKNGATITLQKVPPSKLTEFVGRHSKSYREEYSKTASLHILDSSGKRVGEATVQKKNDDELYLEWLGINKSARGKGYGSAVMQAGREFGKQEGFKRMTLDTVDSPNARHIYEKMGFRYEGKSEEGVRMVYEFDAKHSEPMVDILAHYGVKGMKWGVRKSDDGTGKSSVKNRTETITAKLKDGRTLTLDGDKTPGLAKLISKMSTKFRDKVNNSSNYTLRDPDGKAMGEMSLFKESPTSLNVVWVGVDKSARGNGYASVAMKAAVDYARKQKLDTVTLEVPGNSPDARHIYEKMGFKEDPSKSEPWDPVWGGLTAMELNLNAKHGELAHYGVKGMKWGVRKARPEGVSRSTDRMARKDAKEFARAKQFYGEGAGTRRKLIKARVEGISKKNPGYKKAFDAHLANQDTSKHAAKAKAERKRKNVANSTRKGIRGTSHILRGNSQYASAATAIVVGGALYAHKAGIDKTIASAAKTAYKKARDPKGHQAARNLLRDLGIG